MGVRTIGTPPRTVAIVCTFAAVVTVLATADVWAQSASSRAGTHSLSSVHGVGVDLDPRFNPTTTRRHRRPRARRATGSSHR